MKRSTIEARHQEKVEQCKDHGEIVDYFLDVAHVLESYDDETIDQTTNTNEERLQGYVTVVGMQNKGALYDEYVNIVEKKPNNVAEKIDSYVCNRCNVSKLSIQNDSYMICPQCGESSIYFDSGTQGMSYEQEINSEVNTSFAYKRINHFNEWLAQFQAKETTSIPQQLLDDIWNECKKARLDKKDVTQSRVKTYLKKLGYNKFYEHVPHITNLINGKKPIVMTMHLEEQLRNMFRDIQQPFEKHKPKTRSNFLSYSYCLYKFCELLGKDEFLGCFPLLKSREKLYQQDCIWKKICEEMTWQYIPTI